MDAVGTELGLSLLLRQAEQRVNDRLAPALDAGGVSIEQWRVLALLNDGEGHSMSELAEAASLPAPSLTRLVDKLVALTLVYRRVDAADRRRVLVFLSSRGRSRVKKLAEQERQTERAIMTEFGIDQFEDFGRLLALLVAQLGSYTR